MKNKRFKIFVAIAIVGIITLDIISLHPAYYNNSGKDVPENIVHEIRSHAIGFYSPFLPLATVKVTIDEYYAEEQITYFTIYYFPFGKLKMSLKRDGFGPHGSLTP